MVISLRNEINGAPRSTTTTYYFFQKNHFLHLDERSYGNNRNKVDNTV